MKYVIPLAFVACMTGQTLTAVGQGRTEPGDLLSGMYAWTTAGPVARPRNVAGDTKHAIKDPTVVFHDGRWHLFCTVRGTARSHAIVYLSFENWAEADRAEWRILPMHEGFFCAPQVFYFRPHEKWYLICQASSDAWDPPYRPAFSTTADLADVNSWTPLTPLVEGKPAHLSAWLDFWVICDERNAYLFFTSLDGKMWRCRTSLREFPTGWSAPEVALEGDVFEASHTYRVRGFDKYLTLIEAQDGHGWRYYKAYVADTLAGKWTPLAADKDRAFASMANVRQPNGRWTDSISHGELLRAGVDERLEVETADPRFLIQGVLDADRSGKAYGEIPWSLGLLRVPQVTDGTTVGP